MIECDECGEEFEEDDEFALVEESEHLCRWCNSEVSDD